MERKFKRSEEKTRRRSRSCEKYSKPRVRSPRTDYRRYKDSRQQGRPSRESKHHSKQYVYDNRGESSQPRTRIWERSSSRERLKDTKHRQDNGIAAVRTFIDRGERTNRELSPSGRSRKSVQREIDKMLITERHHMRRVEHHSSGEIREVIWCPQYIRSDIKERARGGISLLYHRCRSCRRLCFHLLGRPGTKRLCLKCSGWKSKYIPEWYYHRRCKDCLD